MEELKKLEQELKKANSLKWNFLKSVFNGLGFFIGSVIVIAFGIYLLSFFDTIPVVGHYISEIIQYLESLN